MPPTNGMRPSQPRLYRCFPVLLCVSINRFGFRTTQPFCNGRQRARLGAVPHFKLKKFSGRSAVTFLVQGDDQQRHSAKPRVICLLYFTSVLCWEFAFVARLEYCRRCSAFDLLGFILCWIDKGSCCWVTNYRWIRPYVVQQCYCRSTLFNRILLRELGVSWVAINSRADCSRSGLLNNEEGWGRRNSWALVRMCSWAKDWRWIRRTAA